MTRNSPEIARILAVVGLESNTKYTHTYELEGGGTHVNNHPRR